MRLKSYFSDSVSEAMDQAARELGSEAMLVFSRETPAEGRHLGAYEVVFAQESSREAGPPESVPEGAAQRQETKIRGSEESSELQVICRELAELRRQVSRISGVMARTGVLVNPAGSRAERLQAISDELMAADVPGDLVQEILAELDPGAGERPADISSADEDALERLVREELSTRFSVDSRLGVSRGGARAVAFVGPPGSGKTSALVKIAARFGLSAKQPAQILSLDMYRVGAAEQLRSFASILGVGFQPLETAEALVQALEDHRRKDLILIDTPGLAAGDFDVADELAEFLAGHPEIDVHLTLPASMKSADLSRCITRFAPFRPTKLLFTRLDETESAGTILNAAIETGMPLSFFSDGQRIPEDLQEATRELILDRVLPERPEVIHAAEPAHLLRAAAASSRAAAA